MSPELPLHRGWGCSCPPHRGREQMHLSTLTGANPFAHTVTWMTAGSIQPSRPSCACPEPTPGAGQDPTLMPRACWPPGKSTGPACFTPGNFTWSSCNRLFCAKLKQCVVLACCILYKNPFPPTHFLKHLYKFYLNRKLEILFTICFFLPKQHLKSTPKPSKRI